MSPCREGSWLVVAGGEPAPFVGPWASTVGVGKFTGEQNENSCSPVGPCCSELGLEQPNPPRCLFLRLLAVLGGLQLLLPPALQPQTSPKEPFGLTQPLRASLHKTRSTHPSICPDSPSPSLAFAGDIQTGTTVDEILEALCDPTQKRGTPEGCEPL